MAPIFATQILYVGATWVKGIPIFFYFIFLRIFRHFYCFRTFRNNFIDKSVSLPPNVFDVIRGIHGLQCFFCSVDNVAYCSVACIHIQNHILPNICTVPVIFVYCFFLAAVVLWSSNDKNTPALGAMIAAPDSNPTNADKFVCNAGATAHPTQVRRSVLSTRDFFLARIVSFVKKNAANNDNVT